MKYIVDIVKEIPESANYNAWAKAPADVIRTLVDNGCTPVFIVVPGNNSLFACIKALVQIILFVMSVKQSDTLFVQRYGYYINLLCLLAKRKKAKVHYIVHDLTFLRFGNENSGKLEKSMIKMVDVFYKSKGLKRFITNIKKEQLNDFYGKPVIGLDGKPVIFEYYYQDYALPEVIITGKRKRKTLSGKY